MQVQAFLLRIIVWYCSDLDKENNYEFDSSEVMGSITIDFSDKNTAIFDINENNISSIQSDEITAFFESNELNEEYYMNWISNQDIENLESVTITVLYPEDNLTEVYSNTSDIQKHRFVYVDANYILGQKTNQFTVGDLLVDVVTEVIVVTISHYDKVMGTIASLFDITDPASYFATDRVRVGQEYYINDGASRVVTKFVELYAPVSGTVKWYAWGYAQSDYVRHGIQFYYKGLEVGSKQNKYHQYYTQRYYNDTSLYNAVVNAYPNSIYEEIADEFSANYIGYTLYERSITREKYLEYDDIVTN